MTSSDLTGEPTWRTEAIAALGWKSATKGDIAKVNALLDAGFRAGLEAAEEATTENVEDFWIDGYISDGLLMASRAITALLGANEGSN